MKVVKMNLSYILCGTNYSTVSRLRSILYGNWIISFIVLATSCSMILPFSNSLYILQARAEPNPPGFDAPDPEQNPNFNCPRGYWMEGNHENPNGPARCTLMTCQNHSELCSCEQNQIDVGGKCVSADIHNIDNCPIPDGQTPVQSLHISEAGLNFIKSWESFAGTLKNECSDSISKNCWVTDDRYGLYQDSSGFCTEGFGYLVGKHACMDNDVQQYHKDHPVGMTEDDANQQLRDEISNKYEWDINLNIGVQLRQSEFDALVDFDYNTGAIGKQSAKKLLSDINGGICDHEAITQDFGQWIYSNHQIANGLIQRRADEAAMFNYGVYNDHRMPIHIYR